MADIDGDGRADWCILLHVGDVACLRNGGSGTLPTSGYGGFWQDFSSGGTDFTTVFPSQHRGNAAGVNLVDINGDFKTDWLFMTASGQVDTYINNRGNGLGMIPDWQYVDVTHPGLSQFNVTNANSAVKFGRMYGTGRRDVRYKAFLVLRGSRWQSADLWFADPRVEKYRFWGNISQGRWNQLLRHGRRWYR